MKVFVSKASYEEKLLLAYEYVGLENEKDFIYKVSSRILSFNKLIRSFLFMFLAIFQIVLYHFMIIFVPYYFNDNGNTTLKM